MEYDSTWQWVTWLAVIVLFVTYFNIAERVRDRIYPNVVTHRGKRQMFNAAAIIGGIVVFSMGWGVLLELIYN